MMRRMTGKMWRSEISERRKVCWCKGMAEGYDGGGGDEEEDEEDEKEEEEDSRWSIRAVQGAEANRPENVPSISLSAREALAVQLDALGANANDVNLGVITLYNYALFNPWSRSDYFGRRLDLGQLERFRNVLHTQPYRILLRNSSWGIISSMSPSERDKVFRVWVEGFRPGEKAQFVIQVHTIQCARACVNVYTVPRRHRRGREERNESTRTCR